MRSIIFASTSLRPTQRSYLLWILTAKSAIRASSSIIRPSPCSLNASSHRTFGEADGWRRQAVALRTTLEQSYAHPLGGFVKDLAGGLP
jgi:hypothetical protein